MAEITTVTLNQLNALTRGSETSAVRSNTSANNPQTLNDVAAKVVISQVSPNTVTLTNPQTRQSVQLPAAALANLGNMKTGQALELVNVANKPNTYALIPAAVTNRQSATVGQQSQLLASTSINVNDNQLTALVAKASAAGDISFAGKPIVNISGRITAISANQVTVNFTVPGSNLPAQLAQITLNQAQVSSLSVNSNVKITLDVSGKQPNIISLSSVNVASAQNSQNAQSVNTILNLGSQLAKLNNAVLPNKLVSASILQQLIGSLPPGSSVANNLQNNASSGLSQVIIPLTDAKLGDLPKSLLSSLQNAIARVNTTAATQVSLLVEGTGNANSLKLSVLGNLSKSSGELNTSQIRTLLATAEGKALGNAGNNNVVDAAKSTLTNKQLASNSGTGSVAGALSNTIAKQGFIASRAELGVNQAGNPTVSNPQSALTDAAAARNPAAALPNFKTDLLLEQLTKFINTPAQTSQPAAQQNPTILTQLLSQLPNTKISSIIEQLSNLAATQRVNPATTIDSLKTQVQALSQSTLAQSASQSQTLSLANIISALNADADIAELSPETQALLRYVRDQLPNTSAAQQTAIDAKTIQQLVAAPLNNAPINALSPTAVSGFLSGLVTLLQVSLASKLQRQSNKQASKMQDQIPDVIKSIVPNVTSAQSAKLLSDFRQFDAKHTLSAEVAKMLFSHQNHKLKSIESSLQGQDQLYYALPNVFDKNADDIELLVKRETRENKNSDNNEGSSSWYLTMKLDVGPLGQMLAKTQLKDDEIKLQLYTSTTELKNKAYDMLPFLQRRLSALGINLTEKSCQLGKIPKQLKTEHYQVFETQV
ncbi:flagellar hook-length control protein FliK [Brumicola nitratireducens]|uniref:Flagellar hook-length control protein-like C-terminal domain-containing protein n=1 Tax=Glaciecola nitratireducens (strain JCM 12485 / KCTC 12276 / FR1064) TaxID=1085623 RepID=G4QM26_GLANF|nr:flagellar hook-length control protein FliK [Glaciecola nitratireducens]AEP30597.1 hypothetical protein GNIT_2500 [Glaciecola nitratireducens FR1064]